MLQKTIAAAAIGAGALLMAAAPASAHTNGDGPVVQGGLINLNDSLNCLLPLNDINLLALDIPVASPSQQQACNRGKMLQK